MMKQITLQFISASDFMGQAIEWFTQAQVCHVDAVLPDGTLLGSQMNDGLGGKPSGVQIRPASYVGGVHKAQVSLDVTDDQYAGWIEFMQEQIGKPYDLKAIAGFITHSNWRDDRAWYCSELHAAGLETIRFFPHPLAAPENKISPQHLFLLVSAFGPVTET
jgi:hypothetical protein